MPTRERILRAATAEFAARGIEGARVARIADEAGANKERLYHYFGDKEALFRACVREATRQIVEAEPFAAEDLAAYTTAMLDFHRRNPALIQLLLAEARHDRSRTPDEERRAHYAARAEAVAEAQAGGAVRADVDARVVVYAVLALVVTAEALPQLTRAILGAGDGAGRGLGDEELFSELAALVAALTARDR